MKEESKEEPHHLAHVCYGLNACVPHDPELAGCSPDPQCDGIWSAACGSD